MRICLLSALVSCRLFAAGEEAAIRSTFVDPWTSAMRQAAQTKNTAALMNFVHPQVLACITSESREFFEGNAAREIGHNLKGPFSVSKIAPLSGLGLLSAFLPSDGFPLPVMPTYEVQIDWGDTSFIVDLAPANGAWYEVLPCPNEKGAAFLHEQAAAGAAQKQRAQQLASELKDPLLGELKALLKQDHIIDAIYRYQATTGADLTTAKTVIDVVRAGQ
jgi:hypothetical protein